MRREFATVLAELRDGLADSAARGGARLVSAEMTLPMDVLVVARDGGVTLLADVPRTRADDAWRDTPSRVRITWQAVEGKAR